MNNDKQNFKAEGIMQKGYGFIPKLIMKDRDLTIEAKSIYAYLSSYTGAGNTAYPSISLMCGDLDISEARFYKHRKLLVDKGYIVIDKQRNESGWVNNVYSLPFTPYPQNLSTQNLSTQNLCIQNVGTKSNSPKSNSIKSNKDKESTKTESIYKPVINYLNEKADRNFKHTTKSTQSHINARVEEGFTLEDFKKVIDVKVKEWQHDNKMNKFIRPQTLFGTKFESYLNQKERTNGSSYKKNNGRNKEETGEFDFLNELANKRTEENLGMR